MTRTEKAKLFFEQLPEKPTALDYKDAAAATGDVSDIAAVLIGHAQARGVDASGALHELQTARDQAGQRIAEEEAAAVLVEKSGALMNEADPEKRRELIDGIYKTAASIGTAGKKDRIGSWAGYEKECTEYDPEKDFRPELFGHLAFPPGTVSYIGGRAKAGKTTVLIHLCREALSNNRKVLFITLEMSRRQLLTKLVLSTAFAITGDAPERGELRGRGTYDRKEQTGQTPQKDYYALLRGKPLPPYGGEQTFTNAVHRARELVKNFYGKTLLVYDGRGAEFPEIINAIEIYGDPGSLVLLDYIQRMPSADETSRDDYTRVKKISNGVLLAAVRTNTVIISGAQFNRTVTRNDKGDEIIETTSFRESGDIEQDAHNILGIGRLAGQGNRYIKMFSGREEMIEDDAYSLDFEGAYSYMAIREKIKAPEEIKHYPRKNKKGEPAPEVKPEEEKKWEIL
jgi:hypothetical protein